MICNLHTHTKRCRHAVGEDCEYVLKAIDGGMKVLGFSDHAPFRFPDGSESKFRIPTAEAVNYIESINALKEKFRDKIEIKVGFEMEYYPLYFNDMRDYVGSLGAEYLILGQHFIGNEEINVNESGHDERMLCKYVDTVIEAMQSGVFTYVAHPDMFVYNENTEIYKREMRRLCRAAKAFDIPLEINCLGIRKSRFYPNSLFWQIAGEEGVTAVFGSDAHSPSDTYDEASLRIAEEIAESNSLKVTEVPKIKYLQKVL